MSSEQQDWKRSAQRMASNFVWWYTRVAIIAFACGVMAGIGVSELARRFDWRYPACVVAFCLGGGLAFVFYALDYLRHGRRDEGKTDG